MNPNEKLNFWGKIGIAGSFLFSSLVVSGSLIPKRSQVHIGLWIGIGGLAVLSGIWAAILIPYLNRRYQRKMQRQEEEEAHFRKNPIPTVHIRAIT